MRAFCVIIPARNAAAFLGQALESVLTQGFPAAEIVVIDDGSADATAEVVRGHGDRVRLIQTPGRGSGHARNVGVASTRAEFLAFLDADDIWRHDKMALQLDFLSRNPETVMVFADLQNFDSEHDLPGTYFEERGFCGHCSPASILLCDMVSTPTVVIRRDAFDSVGGFDESLSIGQDTDLWLRIALQYPFGVVGQPLVRRRLHDGNITRNQLLLARSVVQVWGRYLDRCCAAEPEMAKALRRDFRGKLWHCHFLEGCELRKRGEPRDALRSLARAIRLFPFRSGPWIIAAAAMLPPVPRKGRRQ